MLNPNIFFSEWLWADYMLYHHFKEQFTRKITDFGRHKALLKKEIIENVTEHRLNECRKKNPYTYNLYACNLYNEDELVFLDRVRRIQSIRSINKLESNKKSEKTPKYLEF